MTRKSFCQLPIGLTWLCKRPFEDKDQSGLFPDRDSRLNKQVSIQYGEMWLGDLCDLLSELSGIKISCSDKQDANGEKICVCLKSVPIRDVMEGIWSLNGYQRATWEWIQVKKNGEYTYELRRGNSAARLSQELEAEIQAKFEKSVRRKLQLCQLSDSEIQKAADAGDSDAQDVLKDPFTRKGLQFIGSAFPTNKLLAGLRNPGLQTIQPGQIGQSDKKLVGEIWTKMGVTLSDGTQPDFKNLSISTQRSSICPELSLSMGFGESSAVGWPYTGSDSHEKKTNADFVRGWMLTGDSSKLPKVQFTPNPALQLLSPLNRILTALSEEKESISFLCHATSDQNRIRKLSMESSSDIFEEFQLVNRYSPMLKSRNGIVLISYPNWFLGESESRRVPLALFHRFESKLKRKPIDPLDLEDIADAALYMRSEALEIYASDFPQLQIAFEWQPYLAWVRAESRWGNAVGPRGSLLPLTLRETLATKISLSGASVLDEISLRVSTAVEEGRWVLKLEFQDRKGRVIASAISAVAPR